MPDNFWPAALLRKAKADGATSFNFVITEHTISEDTVRLQLDMACVCSECRKDLANVLRNLAATLEIDAPPGSTSLN